MKKNKDVLCVVPCFNESENLTNLFADIEATSLADHVDFLFIDDFSTDDTFKVITQRGYNCIRHEFNLGYGGSVKTGFYSAYVQNYAFMIIFPGDHQRSAADVINLIKEQHRTQHDVVVGSKFHIYSDYYGPIRRRIGNQIFSNLAKYVWGSPIQDVLSGFKIYKMSSVKRIFYFLPNGYPLDICFSLYASLEGLNISEISVNCRYAKNTTKMRSVVLVSLKMFSVLFYHYFFSSQKLRKHLAALKFEKT